MQKKSADEVLASLIDLLTYYLTDLSEVTDTPDTQFAYGEKTAYTECLEIISGWEKAIQSGIPANVETVFPL